MWSSSSKRTCDSEGCSSEVTHDAQDAGYCTSKYPHWNDVKWSWRMAQCECGTKKTLEENPGASRLHAFWCPSWKKN